MKRLLVFGYGLIIAVSALAQVGGSGVSGITIAGPITAGHCAQWSTKSAVGDSGSACSGGGGSGTVTSVGLSSSGSITITGSPITTSGTFTADIAAAAAANPTASTGLTAVNGSAVTLMRSDASPALDQTIIPTWTGVHKWALTEPRLILNQSGAGTDLKQWDFDVASGVLTGRTRTDADGAGVNWLAVTRGTTTAVSSIALGNTSNNPTVTLLGTGTFTAGGLIVGNSNITTTFSVTANRFFSGGTKFTATGCSNGTTVGGGTAGSYNSGTTGTCTVVLTLPTAPNGYACSASDTTTNADTQTMTASTITSATISGTTVSGDVIKFFCIGY